MIRGGQLLRTARNTGKVKLYNMHLNMPEQSPHCLNLNSVSALASQIHCDDRPVYYLIRRREHEECSFEGRSTSKANQSGSKWDCNSRTDFKSHRGLGIGGMHWDIVLLPMQIVPCSSFRMFWWLIVEAILRPLLAICSRVPLH